jgi:hypothetical protein
VLIYTATFLQRLLEDYLQLLRMEVGIYLSKVKEYEAAQSDKSDSIENKSWQKNVLQLTGSNDQGLGLLLDGYMKTYGDIISDTLFGANVVNYSNSANPAGYADALLILQISMTAGSAMITYFGHSSNSSLDFNLDDPDKYNNAGRYPFFLVNGCVAGNIFDYDYFGNRFTHLSSLSEKFILAPSKGSIAYLSTSSYGLVNYLDVFTNAFYKAISVSDYRKGVGDVVEPDRRMGWRRLVILIFLDACMHSSILCMGIRHQVK